MMMNIREHFPSRQFVVHIHLPKFSENTVHNAIPVASVMSFYYVSFQLPPARANFYVPYRATILQTMLKPNTFRLSCAAGGPLTNSDECDCLFSTARDSKSRYAAV